MLALGDAPENAPEHGSNLFFLLVATTSENIIREYEDTDDDDDFVDAGAIDIGSHDE
jgi:hypothetical protein